MHIASYMRRDDVSGTSRRIEFVHEAADCQEIAAWAHIFGEEGGLPIRLVDEFP